MSGIEIRNIDERWIIDHAVRLWQWLDAEEQRDKIAEQRERRAEERHRELLAAIADSTTAVVKAVDGGFRLLAETLRR